MLFFTLLFNVIMGLGIFTDVDISGGLQMEGNVTEQFKALTQGSRDYPKGIVMDNIWSIVFVGGVGGIVLAIATRSVTIIGVYIFAAVFWASYLNLISILGVGGFLQESAPIWGFVAIGTMGVTVAFGAAIAGMLSGSG